MFGAPPRRRRRRALFDETKAVIAAKTEHPRAYMEEHRRIPRALPATKVIIRWADARDFDATGVWGSRTTRSRSTRSVISTTAPR